MSNISVTLQVCLVYHICNFCKYTVGIPCSYECNGMFKFIYCTKRQGHVWHTKRLHGNLATALNTDAGSQLQTYVSIAMVFHVYYHCTSSMEYMEYNTHEIAVVSIEYRVCMIVMLYIQTFSYDSNGMNCLP